MGNSTALAYDVTTTIEYKNEVLAWNINNANKQNATNNDNEFKDNFCIFRIPLSTNKQQQQQSNEYILAVKGIQRLKLLKHPYVLKFVENTEINDSIVLVTESVTPLETWLINLSTNEINVQLQEILWGCKCILLALHFLHSNCNMIHGNIGLHSIFVTPSGDWKLGCFEIAGNMSLQSDIDHFIKYQHLLPNEYCPPERLSASNLTEALKPSPQCSVPFHLDIYSLGQVIQKVLNKSNMDMPRSLHKYITSMLQQDYKKRTTASKLCQSSIFNSEDMQFIENIGELSIKSPKEFLEVISKMEDKIHVLSKPVCAHKILPNISRSLQIAINDFPLRDARETCRKSVQVSISLLTKLSLNDKIDQAVFRVTCVPVIVQLWAMADRSIRTFMLQSLKALIPFIPENVINKTIFDQMMAGFSDSNVKLREATLMNLIYVVDKLEELQLQDKLVRCITNLQNDVEPSIRTNSTIFLGKIAGKLKEAVRARVLCTAFQKAMKDNFLHCRIAGLKTSNACIKLLEPTQLATKIIPQASLNALDKSHEIRNLSLVLLDSCIIVLKNYNEETALKNKHADNSNVDNTNNAAASSSSNQIAKATSSNLDNNTDTSWSSWSVLQGISKTLESATIVHTSIDGNSSSSISNINSNDKIIGMLSQKSSGSTMDEMNYQDFMQQTNEQQQDYNNNNNREGQSSRTSIGETAGWDDDLDELNLDDAEGDINEDDDDDRNTANETLSISKSNHHSINAKKISVNSNATAVKKENSFDPPDILPSSSSSKKSSKVVSMKGMVKKLDISKEEDDMWDDF